MSEKIELTALGSLWSAMAIAPWAGVGIKQPQIVVSQGSLINATARSPSHGPIRPCRRRPACAGRRLPCGRTGQLLSDHRKAAALGTLGLDAWGTFS